MSIDLDGMAVLNAIARRPDIFPTASDAINELARKTIETRITARESTLALLRDIAALLDETDLLQVLDSLSPSKIGNLAKKLDKEKPGLAQAGSQWHRQHVLALATGKAEPAPKPVKPKKSGTPAVPKSSAPSKRRVKRTLSSKAMKASYGGKAKGDED